MNASKKIKRKEGQLKMDRINGEAQQVDSVAEEAYKEVEQFEYNEEGIRGLDY